MVDIETGRVGEDSSLLIQYVYETCVRRYMVVCLVTVVRCLCSCGLRRARARSANAKARAEAMTTPDSWREMRRQKPRSAANNSSRSSSSPPAKPLLAAVSPRCQLALLAVNRPPGLGFYYL